MKYAKFLLLLALPVILVQCNSHERKQENNDKVIVKTKIHDGLFLIIKEYTDTTNIHAGKGILISVNPDFLNEKLKGEALKLEIDTSDFVPLELASAPDSTIQPDKKVKLFLSLTDSASKKLSSFTEKHLNKKVALVINGQVVTKHKVRAKITDGKVQVTRCTDNACKVLYIQLKDDYKKKKNVP